MSLSFFVVHLTNLQNSRYSWLLIWVILKMSGLRLWACFCQDWKNSSKVVKSLFRLVRPPTGWWIPFKRMFWMLSGSIVSLRLCITTVGIYWKFHLFYFLFSHISRWYFQSEYTNPTETSARAQSVSQSVLENTYPKFKHKLPPNYEHCSFLGSCQIWE